MKKSFKFIFTAIVTITVLASCVKENFIQDGKDMPESNGTRVIGVSFEDSTKTTLGGRNGFSPKFSDGDKILVANGNDTPQECTVTVDGSGIATFSTTLSGYLKVVYPSNAAKMNATNPNQIDDVIVPAVQTGRFADANIALGGCSEDATSMTLYNQTAIFRFYVDSSIGVKSITVTSSSADINSAGDGYDHKTITVDPEGDVTLDQVTDDTDKRICYVAVYAMSNPTINSIKFTSVTTTQGTVERNAKAADIYSTVCTNTIYNAFLPYYIDLGTAGKWGYCNVGAFLPEQPGKYFAYGDVSGQTWDGSSWSDGGFYSTPNIGNTDVLPLDKDAANVNWGGNWRMPTQSEIYDLITATGTTQSDFVDGILTINGHDDLKFPAAGSGFDSAFVNGGSRGLYRSSNCYDTDKATTLYFDSDGINTNFNSSSRSHGLSVRPVYDLPSGALSGEFSVSADKKVKFSKGNLTYNVSTGTWAFYDHQYDCASAYDSNLISLFTWGYGTWSTTPDTKLYLTTHSSAGENFDSSEDWGTQIVDGNTWRTLTIGEWNYLKSSITERYGKHKTGVTVCGKPNCIVLAPDDWNLTANPLQSSYDETSWPIAEAAGLVCLPAAGYRYGSEVSYPGERGMYWSSTLKEAQYIWGLGFNPSFFDLYGNRDRAYSVRLVTDVERP